MLVGTLGSDITAVFMRVCLPCFPGTVWGAGVG